MVNHRKAIDVRMVLNPLEGFGALLINRGHVDERYSVVLRLQKPIGSQREVELYVNETLIHCVSLSHEAQERGPALGIFPGRQRGNKRPIALFV